MRVSRVVVVREGAEFIKRSAANWRKPSPRLTPSLLGKHQTLTAGFPNWEAGRVWRRDYTACLGRSLLNWALTLGQSLVQEPPEANQGNHRPLVPEPDSRYMYVTNSQCASYHN